MEWIYSAVVLGGSPPVSDLEMVQMGGSSVLLVLRLINTLNKSSDSWLKLPMQSGKHLGVAEKLGTEIYGCTYEEFE